jgi:hypothetical protein
MAGADKKMRNALKRTLIPYLESEGFGGKFPDFQRKEKDVLHLLSVHFDKHGGGFYLEFAKHPVGDKKTSWGEIVPEQKLNVAYAPAEDRARLQENANPNSLREDWFRFDNLSESEIEALVKRVIALFTQVNDWLRDKKVGKNISAFKT